MKRKPEDRGTAVGTDELPKKRRRTPLFLGRKAAVQGAKRAKKKESSTKILRRLEQKMDEIQRDHKQLKQDVTELKLSAQFAAGLGEALEFSEGAATQQRDGGFRDRLVGYYASQVEVEVWKKKENGTYKSAGVKKRFRCAATGAVLPPEDCVASHLFKHSWSSKKDQLQIPDIDDPRNGLILCKAVESAYDNSQICFVRTDGALRLHVLDPSLASVSVLSHTQALQGPRYIPPDNSTTRAHNPEAFAKDCIVTGTTFSELEGRPLSIPEHRQPFNRCLCFQAHMARRRAAKLGWIGGINAFPFVDFWTEGEPYVEKVQAWLATSGP